MFFRIKVIGADNAPKEGGALIVSNHLSWADASLLLYVFKRPIRFLIYRDIHNIRLVNFFTAGINCIPISFEDKPKAIVQSLQEAAQAIENGELVCIFPEGRISRDGTLLPFRQGLKRLLKNKVIPVNIAGIAGSFLTPPLGPVNKRKWFGKACLAVGSPLEGDIRPEEVRASVHKLGRVSFSGLFEAEDTVGRACLKALRRKPLRTIFSDSEGRSLNGLTLFWAASKVAESVPEKSGNLLPSSCAAVICTVASALKDQEIINLNYTSNPSASMTAAGIEKVITSKVVLKKTGIELCGKEVFLEEVLSRPKVHELMRAFAKLYFGKFEFRNEVAALLFTSGSTSTPKGVQLSHLNLLSNTEAIATVYGIQNKFSMLGILPPFHGFGLTGNILLPLFTGMKTTFHSNPLDSKSVEKLLQSIKPNVLLTTPTFLRMWLQKISPDSLKSVKFLVTGAEPLPRSLHAKIKESTGVDILQGYGCTETSPVISVSLDNASPLSCGRPIPGTALRLGEGGRLYVSGPNVMLGYLGEQQQDEWYDTGDIAEIDLNGELFITGRASRFSKIAGEMVSHTAVEEAIQDEVLVVSVPDPGKGEKLVCLHQDELSKNDVRERIKEAGLPNLAIPELLKVEEIPKTGTGKQNLKAASELAKEAFCQRLPSGRP